MPAPRKYPDELRERAVRLVFEPGRPIAHVANDLGVHREALRQWVRQAEADSVVDALDNALPESFVDSFKTELISDRLWRTREQLEFAIVEYLGWPNCDRLHSSLGYVRRAEFEELSADYASSDAYTHK